MSLSAGGMSVRVRRRSLGVAASLVLAGLVLAVVTLTTGDFAVPLPDVLAALAGGGDPGTTFVVRGLRLPRVLVAVLVGAALGASGAMFQSLTANPLGSPDFIGFTAGAATGGIVSILLLNREPAAVALATVIGGLLAAAVVYGLAWRHGGVQPFRLVLVGLGIGWTLFAANAYLLTRATVSDALGAQRWLLGSVNGADWSVVRWLGIALLLLLPGVLAVGRPLAAMETGEDASRALGVPLRVARPATTVVGVALAAVATAAAGPVAFVALVAPQIGRALTRATGPNVTVGAIAGAVLMLAADLAARLVLPQGLPVGLVTGLIGGAYLAWLLTRRRGA